MSRRLSASASARPHLPRLCLARSIARARGRAGECASGFTRLSGSARQKVRQESAREERENGRKSEIFLQFSLRFLPARYALRDCRCEGDGRHVAAARDTRQSRWIAAGLATLCAKLLSAAAIAQTAGLASQHVGLAFCRVVPWLSELLDVFCQDRLRTAKLVFQRQAQDGDLPRGC